MDLLEGTSQEAASSATASVSKVVRIRTERACRTCRFKKRRCDGETGLRSECSYCVLRGYVCVFAEGADDQPPERLEYVKRLEARIAKVKGILDRLANERKSPAGASAATDAPLIKRDHRVDVGRGLENRLQQMKQNPARLRFTGESSERTLLQTAIHIRSDHAGRFGARQNAPFAGSRRRPEFWNPPLWETQDDVNSPIDDDAFYESPEEDLMLSLVDLYFANVNLFWPLLHRPTFDASVASGLHLADADFAAVLLLVCATGAQYADDPRVLLDPAKRQSAGWAWFRQVDLAQHALRAVPSLYGIQAYCLSIVFLRHTALAETAWRLTGIGLRMAQDIGAHRRDVYCATPNAHDELWKRAFWTLVFFDANLSTALGQQCAIQTGDYDLDFPIECDDDYWAIEDSAMAFKQPRDKPSRVTCFVWMSKLGSILSSTLRGLYAIRPAETVISPPRRSKRQTMAVLDSALNEWADTLPEHLRWSPERPDDAFYTQSALLSVIFHSIRTVIHRAFLRDPHKHPSLSLSSLAICTHATSSCIHVMDAQLRRQGVPLLHFIKPAFSAGMILMLCVLGSRRLGVARNYERQMDDVQKCVDFLTACESRTYLAGRPVDMLREMASKGNLAVASSIADEDDSTAAPASDGGPAWIILRDREPKTEDVTRAEDAEPRQTDWERLFASFWATHAGDAGSDTARSQSTRPSLAETESGLSSDEASSAAEVCDPERYMQPQCPASKDVDPLEFWSDVPWGDDFGVWSSYVGPLTAENAPKSTAGKGKDAFWNEW